MADFGLPVVLASPLGLLLPLAELAVAVALIPTTTAWVGSLGALVLLLAFIAGISVNMARGNAPDCHCFGQLHSEPVGWPTLIRNGILALLTLFVALQGPGHPGSSAVSWLGHLTTFEVITLVVAVIGFAILAVQSWVIVHLMQQQGRLLLRFDALDGTPGLQPASPSPAMGLPAGTPAPGFQLPDLDGTPVSLDALRETGKPVLLLFTDPQCGPCQALLPDVGAWQREHADRLTLALVSRGTVDENRAKAEEHGLAPVLLQGDREVATAYLANATPSAVLISSHGSIAGPVAAGAEEIKGLLARAIAPSPAIPLLPQAPIPHGGNGQAPQPAARIGDPIPPLRLPALDGTPVDLAGVRGQETAVLFWNPGCGFCQRMLPDLKAWEASPPPGAPALLVVSTGTVEANRAQGIQSPLVLDGDFAAGRAFGANGTPMAVLIDAEGRIASEVVAGAPAALGLLGNGAVPTV
jgi:peroxiredoxin